MITKQEVMQAFPIDSRVRTNSGYTGIVTDYAVYNVAFIGFRTFVLVSTLSGRPLGEFAAANLKAVTR